MESYDIPEDLIIEIFKRLPAKSLIRFKRVNKASRNLISSSDFATRHFDFNKNKRLSSYIRMSEYRMQLFTDGKHAAYLRRPFMEHNYELMRSFGDIRYILIGSSSNGLVCVRRDDTYSNFTIWNPATGDFRSIPPSPSTNNCRKIVGFDVRPCGDYRVVVIIEKKVVEIYSRSSNCWSSKSWKTIPVDVAKEDRHIPSIFDDVAKNQRHIQGGNIVSLDGCMYWQMLGGLTADYSRRYQNVACFDMWEEKCRTITGPPWTSLGDMGILGVVNGSSLGIFFEGEVEGTLDGWVMNAHDGSWTKQYSVVPFEPEHFIDNTSGEDVDTIILNRQLHFYHNDTKKICSFTNLPGQLDVVQYKEALFPVYNPTT